MEEQDSLSLGQIKIIFVKNKRVWENITQQAADSCFATR
jgi:hypothetical protein